MTSIIKFEIPNVNLEHLKSLQDKYNFVVKGDEINLDIKIKNFDVNLLTENLDNFLLRLNSNRKYKFSPECYFDGENSSINFGKEINTLTKREANFLELLINRNSVVTYDEMFRELWQDKNFKSMNAIRLFIKNLKKKLPENIILNYQNFGYKLNTTF